MFSVEDLKVQIHDSTTVPTSELFLALPNGHIMENWEHVASCIMVSVTHTHTHTHTHTTSIYT